MFRLSVLVISVLVLLSPLTAIVQTASGVLVAAQITSAKSDGSNIANGGFITIHGTSTVLTFDFRGFDDDNHVLELRCSFDGINYLRTTCPTQSAESQSIFAGPDGVVRNYNVKTGTVSRQVTPSLVGKTYFFGVRAFNDNNNLSPPATFSFKMRSSGVGGTGGPANGEAEAITHTVTVKFDSITINNDHDPDMQPIRPGVSNIPLSVQNPGEWQLISVVQGKLVGLFGKTETKDISLNNGAIQTLTGIVGGKQVLTGKTYNFPPGTQVTVRVGEKTPLSIFTFGRDHDCGDWSDLFYFHAPADIQPSLVDLNKILSNPNLVWSSEIKKIQQRISYLILSGCSDEDNVLGGINVIYQPPKYQAFPHSETSDNADYLLRYSVVVSP